MKTVPMFMRGAFRAVLKVGLEEIRRGHAMGNEEVLTRGWKLFLLLPRMLLFRPPRGGFIPRRRLEELTQFNRGEWGHIGRKFIGACNEWGHGNGEEEASKQERRGTQNSEGFPLDPSWGVCLQHVMCWSLPRLLQATRQPGKF